MVSDGEWDDASDGFANYASGDALENIGRQGVPVGWTITEDWQYTSWYDSPEIANLVQARVDDPDYSSGDYFGLVLYHISGHYHRVGTQGSGELYVKWESDPAIEDQADETEVFTDDVRHSGDPVDVITGNMHTFPQVDFTLSGINEPLEFSRTYNSQSEYDGPFGYGWTHKYNVILTMPTDDETVLEILDGKGKSHFFVDLDEDDTFDATNNDGTYVVRTSGTPDTFVWTTKDGKEYHFDTLHDTVCYDPPTCDENEYLYYVTSIEYKDGSTIEFDYDGSDHLETITDTHGREIEFTYSGARIIEIQEPGRPANMPIEYEYDGNLTKVTYPIDAGADYERNYSYDDQNDIHNLTEIEDERGNSFYFTYDANDKCTKSEGENFGAGPYFKTEFDYDTGTENETEVTRTSGAQTFTDTYTYNGLGYVTEVVYEDSGITEKYTYDIVPGDESTLEKLTMKSADSFYHKKITVLDESFNVIRTTEGLVASESADPSGDPLEMYYEDATNNPNYLTRILDQRDVNLKLTYNTDGKITQVHKYKEGSPGTQYEITTFTYDEDSLLTAITDGNDNDTEFDYDEDGNLTSMDPPGDPDPVSYDHDNAGRLIEVTKKDDSGGDIVTEIDRDWLGRITEITYDVGGEDLSVAYDYDATDLYAQNASYGINVTDTEGVKTQYLYNSAGLLWKVVRDRGTGQDNLNVVTEFEYDAYGNLIELTDGEGNSTTFAYDSLDRLTSITDEASETKSFTYYPDGSLKTRTDQNNQTTEYSYDDDNRLEEIEYPDQSMISYTYEDNGLVASVTNSAGAVTFSYDDANRVSTTNGAHTGTVDEVTYTYDDAGLRDTMTLTLMSGIGDTEYLYTDWNAISQITNPYDRDVDFTYNQYTGAISRITHYNGAYTDYDFDDLDRFDSYSVYYPYGAGGTIPYDYVYGDSNKITRITIPGGDYYTYEYDHLNQLTEEQLHATVGYTKGFEYDKAGNRIEQTGPNAEGYTINALNQITEIYEIGENPHYEFDYDDNGNMIEQTVVGTGSVTFDYDYENRLVEITYLDNSTTEFVYDALGRRLMSIEKNSSNQVISEKHFVYDGLNLLAELNGNDALVASFTHDPYGLDSALMMRLGANDYYYHTNHQNSVTFVSNSAGAIAKYYRYDAFGKIMVEQPPTPVSSGFTFTGREIHLRTDLYYYRNRFYYPALGRFMTPDPIGLLGGVNLYAYTGNDPVNWVDPLGLTKIDIWEIGGYKIIKIPGDTHYGGPHYHIETKSGKLLGKVNIKSGKVVRGKVPKSLLSKMAKRGLLGGLLVGVVADLLIFPDEVASATLSDYYIEQYVNGEIPIEELMELLAQTTGCPPRKIQ